VEVIGEVQKYRVSFWQVDPDDGRGEKSDQRSSVVMNNLTQLQEFRQELYKNLCKAKDATFELMDALLLTRKAQSLADLSLCPVFRRQWSRALSLWDSEYGCAPFVNQTAQLPVDQLMRLRSNLCLWGKPPADEGRGRPRVHGDKFKLNDPTTWSEPAQVFEVDDPELG
jgi:DDE superfamily endonuclease